MIGIAKDFEMIENFRELVKRSRSYRRFDSKVKLDKSKITDWIDIARHTPSGVNRQPLKYIVVADSEPNDKVFQCLTWAGLLPRSETPKPDQQPAGYVIILHDKTVSPNYYCDHGIVAQTILLAATADGFGGCMLAAIDRQRLTKILNITDKFDILLVIALGKPDETIVIETMVDDNYKYHRDINGVHHVPKRSLNDVIIDFADNNQV